MWIELNRLHIAAEPVQQADQDPLGDRHVNELCLLTGECGRSLRTGDRRNGRRGIEHRRQRSDPLEQVVPPQDVQRPEANLGPLNEVEPEAIDQCEGRFESHQRVKRSMPPGAITTLLPYAVVWESASANDRSSSAPTPRGVHLPFSKNTS